MPTERISSFVVSLDFELYWGVRDKRSLESYKANLLGVRAVVPALLSAFREHRISATWATVGFLFFKSREELLAGLPSRTPGYSNRDLCPYSVLDQVGRNEDEDPFHFAHSLVRRVLDAGDQEIATHTFSHYYCLERGQTLDDFRADLVAAQRAAAQQFGISLSSIVFPRNQMSAGHLDACREAGIRAYRGNPRGWLYAARNEAEESRVRRAIRLADAYLPLSGTNVFDAERMKNGIVNVPASRFLRPISRSMSALDALRLRRIVNDMRRAASLGVPFHLWWHPHNFGRSLEANMAFLRRILEEYRRLHDAEGMQSRTMGQVAEMVA